MIVILTIFNFNNYNFNNCHFNIGPSNEIKAMELAKRMFGANEISIYGTADAPLFMAADIAKILEITTIRQTVSKLEEYEKEMIPAGKYGCQREVAALTEAGLYSLIIKSRKPVAKEFKKWLLTEVLPAIRRNGRYDMGNFIERAKYNELEAKFKEAEADYDTLLTEHEDVVKAKDTELKVREGELRDRDTELKAKEAELTTLRGDSSGSIIFNLDEYIDEPCVYLIHLGGIDYKFGVTGEIDVRLDTHFNAFKKLGLTPQIIKLWKCPSMKIMKATEKKIKLFSKHAGILVDKYDQKEIISTSAPGVIIKHVTDYVTEDAGPQIEILKLQVELAKLQSRGKN